MALSSIKRYATLDSAGKFEYAQPFNVNSAQIVASNSDDSLTIVGKLRINEEYYEDTINSLKDQIQILKDDMEKFKMLYGEN